MNVADGLIHDYEVQEDSEDCGRCIRCQHARNVHNTRGKGTGLTPALSPEACGRSDALRVSVERQLGRASHFEPGSRRDADGMTYETDGCSWHPCGVSTTARDEEDATWDQVCCLHTRLDKGGAAFGGSKPPGRRGESHPYLFGLVSGRLCSPCSVRVKFTREALRVLSAGERLKDPHALRGMGWCWPSLDVTHSLHPTPPLVVSRNGAPIGQGQSAGPSEGVCAVCAQDDGIGGCGGGDGTDDGSILFCQGKLGGLGSSCRLSYHRDCLVRVGWLGGQGDEAGLASCPFCGGQGALNEEEKQRMGKGYSVRAQLRAKRQRAVGFVATGEAAATAATAEVEVEVAAEVEVEVEVETKQGREQGVEAEEESEQGVEAEEDSDDEVVEVGPSAAPLPTARVQKRKRDPPRDSGIAEAPAPKRMDPGIAEAPAPKRVDPGIAEAPAPKRVDPGIAEAPAPKRVRWASGAELTEIHEVQTEYGPRADWGKREHRAYLHGQRQAKLRREHQEAQAAIALDMRKHNHFHAAVVELGDEDDDVEDDE